MQFVETKAFLWAWGTVAVCQLQRKPFDAQLVKQDYPPPHTLASLQQAIEDLGLRYGVITTQPEPGLSLPALVALNPSDETVSPEPSSDEAPAFPSPLRLALLLNHSQERTLILEPGQSEPMEINKLRGKATMLFIAHQLPKGLHVDEVVTLGQHGAKVAVVANDIQGKKMKRVSMIEGVTEMTSSP